MGVDETDLVSGAGGRWLGVWSRVCWGCLAGVWPLAPSLPEYGSARRPALARETRPFVADLRLPQDQADDCVQVASVQVLKHFETGRATPSKEGALVAEAAQRRREVGVG